MEIKYLNNIMSEVIFTERFKVVYGCNKIVFGIISPKDNKNIMARICEYKTINDSLIYLDNNIKFSF